MNRSEAEVIVERRSGEDRRKNTLDLRGTYFLERRRPGYDRRSSHFCAQPPPLFPSVYVAAGYDLNE